jgi:hypothetical protein
MAAESYPTPTIYALPTQTAPKSSGIKKFCSLCKAEKPIEEFALFKRSPDGHRWHCATCVPSGPRPPLKHCPLCHCDREITLFPPEPGVHPAGRTMRRWYCVIGQELIPREVREFEKEKRKLWQIQLEITAKADEERRLLNSRVSMGPDGRFSDLLGGIRRILKHLWVLFRQKRAELLRDASELQYLLFDGSRPPARHAA